MKSIAAAVIGGVLGAVIWGAIAHFTGYEVGYVAWGIGALVGFLSAAAGGMGSANGMMCALVTIVALVGGKYVALKLSLDKELQPILEPQYTMMKEEGQKFAALSSREEWKQFMVENEYSVESDAASVSPAELAEFEEFTVPILEAVNGGWTYDDFQAYVIEQSGGMMGAIKESFGVMDILFFLLGIATAFKIGSGMGEEA